MNHPDREHPSNWEPEHGGPAFPRTGTGNAGVSYDFPAQNGMFLRDWFAGQALAGLLAENLESGQKRIDYGSAAEFAYRFADAMIAARSRIVI